MELVLVISKAKEYRYTSSSEVMIRGKKRGGKDDRIRVMAIISMLCHLTLALYFWG